MCPTIFEAAMFTPIQTMDENPSINNKASMLNVMSRNFVSRPQSQYG